MTETAGVAAASAGGGRIGPAAGSGLEYRAFVRQVEGVSGYVVMVMASCYYPVTPWRIFFEGSVESGLTLMQEEPSVYYGLTDFVSAVWAPGTVLPQQKPATVQVTDGYGTHAVVVEEWSNGPGNNR